MIVTPLGSLVEKPGRAGCTYGPVGNGVITDDERLGKKTEKGEKEKLQATCKEVHKSSRDRLTC